jgi:hypothetical protein
MSTAQGMSKSQFRFLNVVEASQEPIEAPDIYATPEYGRAAEVAEKASWELARCSFPECGVACYYVYLKRPVHDADGNTICEDLISPYGYSGPWATGDVKEVHWNSFREQFVDYAVKKNYAAEFVRFSPLLEEHQKLFRLTAEGTLTSWLHQDTVAIDICAGVEAYMKRSKKRHRRGVRKAQHIGYAAKVSTAEFNSLELFVKLYENTMRRTKAKSTYFFPIEYYEALCSGLGSHLKLVTITHPNGTLAAAALYMTWDKFLHYHLGGSADACLGDGVNDLLHHVTASWGVENGFRIQHLGGGLKNGDGLHAFKQSIGDIHLSWYLGKATLSRNLYDKLVEIHAERQGVQKEALVATGYFPAYRAQA